MLLLWVKVVHIFLVISWFVGLFYLPRLFVNHAMVEDHATDLQLQKMERKLFRFTTPIALLTIVSGLWLWHMGYTGGWLHAKVFLVGVLLLYHIACGRFVTLFAQGRNRKSHVWFRVFNEIPGILLFVILILVIIKPF
jgi:putative membrane protein